MTNREQTKVESLNLCAVVADLARLSPLEYDQQREARAKELNVRVGTLDKEVAQARCGLAEVTTASIVEELTPWSVPVDGFDLLNEIATILRNYVYLPESTPTALAAWILGTYAMDAWTIFPKLLITSPEKRCGKTTLLEVLESLSCRALVASNISPSAIFRCIEEWQPTLILDEADTFTKDNDELNGIINAGHRKRTARIIRSEKVNDGFIPKVFSVWAPQVIAGIGSQRDTLHDRSIHIEMERKLPDEQVQKIPHNLFEQYRSLREKCLRWAQDNMSQLKQEIPIPNYGNDRAQDNWQPLARIGHVAGENWVDQIVNAYRIFSMVGAESEDAGILLLRDIQAVLSRGIGNAVTSAELVTALIGIDDSPWGEWRRGKPMTQNSLARLLKPFKISSGTIRKKEGTAKGYKLSQFENAFARYLQPLNPLDQSVTTSQLSNNSNLSSFQSVTPRVNVTLLNPHKPSIGEGCDGVTVKKPQRVSLGVVGGIEDVEYF